MCALLGVVACVVATRVADAQVPPAPQAFVLRLVDALQSCDIDAYAALLAPGFQMVGISEHGERILGRTQELVLMERVLAAAADVVVRATVRDMCTTAVGLSVETQFTIYVIDAAHDGIRVDQTAVLDLVSAEHGWLISRWRDAVAPAITYGDSVFSGVHGWIGRREDFVGVTTAARGAGWARVKELAR